MNSFLNFLSLNDILIDEIYIDNLYISISNKKWILISNEVLIWCGYKLESKKNKLRDRYLNILNNNFIKVKDYKIMSLNEFINYDKDNLNIMYNIEKNTNNRASYLIVSPRTFKESLMLLETEKAKMIRRYYLDLEECFNKYVEYTTGLKIAELKEENERLRNEKNNLEVRYLEEFKPLNAETYIYVMSSKNYIKHNIFKIGQTKHLNARIKSYGTGRHHSDKLELIFSMKVINSEAFEKFIFSKLKQFKSTNKDFTESERSEMFCINYYMLIDIMNSFKKIENENTNDINNIFKKYKPEDIKNINVVDDFDKIVKDANLNADIEYKEYKTPASNQIIKINNSKFLNSEIINDAFKEVNICLESEYTGKIEDAQQWKCLNILNHSFSSTYENAREEYLNNKKGCPFCRKHQILDKINWYVYEDNSYNFISKYESFDEIKKYICQILPEEESNSKIKIIKNIIREERWLTPVNNMIFSILSPIEIDSIKKLDLNKTLNKQEQFIINTLGINYKLMKQSIFKTKFNFIMAIDNKNLKCYVSNSMTKLSNNLTYIDSDKRLNRKTVSKYLDSEHIYAGYLFISCDNNLIETYKSNYVIENI